MTPHDITRALDGDRASMQALVRLLGPVIQQEVGWALARRAGSARGRDVRQEVGDMVQEVFLALLADEGRLLRQWDPDRGAGLRGFVKLVARQQVWSILRTGRRSPWAEDPTEGEHLSRAMDAASTGAPPADARLASADTLRRLMALIRAHMDTRSVVLFERLYVEERSVEAVCEEFQMSRDALYAWRTRMKRRLKGFRAQLEQAPTAAR